MDKFNIATKLRGFDLTFKTTYDLFSFRKIDDGTKLLIDSVKVNNGEACLDLGCGYGAVGIVMAKLNPTGKVYFVDRDFIAVDFSKENCQINKVKNYETRLSNGFSNLKGINLDVIASNLPTHIAKEALEFMISDTKKHLSNNGRFYVVTVDRLRPYIERELRAVFGNSKQVSHNKNYSVSLAIRINPS